MSWETVTEAFGSKKFGTSAYMLIYVKNEISEECSAAENILNEETREEKKSINANSHMLVTSESKINLNHAENTYEEFEQDTHFKTIKQFKPNNVDQCSETGKESACARERHTEPFCHNVPVHFKSTGLDEAMEQISFGESANIYYEPVVITNQTVTPNTCELGKTPDLVFLQENSDVTDEEVDVLAQKVYANYAYDWVLMSDFNTVGSDILQLRSSERDLQKQIELSGEEECLEAPDGEVKEE